MTIQVFYEIVENAKEQMRGVVDENLEEVVNKRSSGSQGFGNFGDSGTRIN